MGSKVSPGVLLGLLFGALLLLVRFIFLFRLNIHWDEFFYLSQIFDRREGRLADPLQTFHTELFSPLLFLSGEEPDLIIGGRILSFLCSLVSLGLFLRQSLRVASERQVVFATLLWLSLVETLIHANSFRSDGICLFLILAALSALRSARPLLILSSIFLGLALLFSIKSALIFVILLPLYAFGDEKIGVLRKKLLLCGLGGLFVFSAGYLWHKQYVVPRQDIGLAVTEQPLATALFDKSKEFLIPSEFPRGINSIFRSLCWQPFLFILMFSLLFIRWRRGDHFEDWEKWTSVLLLGILVFYRNSFPYFLPCLSLPLCLMVGRSIPDIFTLSGYRLILCAVFAQGVLSAKCWLPYGMDEQRKIIHAVHQRFPEPVPYIDRCGMVSSFPKVGPFLSSLVLERYTRKGLPVYAGVLEKYDVAFLVDNSPLFQNQAGLLAEDQMILSREFLPTDIPNILIRRKRAEFATQTPPRLIPLFAPY